MTLLKRFSAAIACLMLVGLTVRAAGQGPPSSRTPLVIKSPLGADLYQFSCSSCHGSAATGGPARSADSPAPPDLTILSKRNKGVFPRDRVRDTIRFGRSGSRLAAHGTADMPVWGTVFRGLDPDDAMTQIRIDNLVQYLASLQEAAKGDE